MRVLVTGHLGYIGTVMVPMLIAEGFDVVGLDTDLFERSTFGEGIVSVPHIKKDVRDVEASDLKGFEASCFDGAYITGDVLPEYLDRLEAARELAAGSDGEPKSQLNLNLAGAD